MFSQRLPSSVYAGYGPWKFNEGWVSKHGNQTIRKPTGIGKCGFHNSTEEESLSLKYFDSPQISHIYYIISHIICTHQGFLLYASSYFLDSCTLDQESSAPTWWRCPWRRRAVARWWWRRWRAWKCPSFSGFDARHWFLIGIYGD